MSPKRHVSILVIVLICAAAAVADDFDLPGLADTVRPSVLLLVTTDKQDKPLALGSGFLLSEDGLVATNYHVIKGADKFIAKSDAGRTFRILGILATDPEHDLTILKIDAHRLPFLRLGSSSSVRAGSKIAVIGSPLGLEGSLSDGIVSAVRDLDDHSRLLQITAPISHGSSGSPVVNGAGQVVGVASLTLASGQSVNFAIAVEHLKKLLASATAASAATEFTFTVDRRGRLTLAERKSGQILATDMPDLPKQVTQDYLRHLALDYPVFCMKLGRITGGSTFAIKSDEVTKGGDYSAVVLRFEAQSLRPMK
jgi:S1-C subfamily serine protease